MKCFKYFRYQDDDYFAMKAAARLAKEMDIKRFIRAIRSSKNSMKFHTTRNERRIIQMQADKNVLTLKEEGKGKLENLDELSENELNFLIGESEAFTSDDYLPFLDKLKEEDDKYGTITTRENLLMQGCLLKEQEIRNLINLSESNFELPDDLAKTKD